MIDKLLIGILCIVPFSHFIFNKMDIWHAQGYFLQLGILFLYCLEHSKRNKPLAYLIFWVGFITWINWGIISVATKNYPIVIFMPFFNLLCIVIFYQILTKLNKEFFNKLSKYIFYSILVVLIYSLLQKLNLDQFYNSTDKSNINDELVGIMGNPMHLAHYIAICLPFLFRNKIVTLLALTIILFTGSVSGLIISLCIIVFYSLFYRIFSLKETILLSICGIIFYIWKYGNLLSLMQDFTFSSGRIKIWKDIYPIFAKKPITGWGLGKVVTLSIQPQFFTWRHLHNEFYQISLELGLVGLSLAIWVIIDYFKRFKNSIKDNVSVSMASVFLGFLLSACFGYPSHLWILASIGTIGYSYQYLEA